MGGKYKTNMATKNLYNSVGASTTGDMKNNLLKLLREIRRMKLNVEPDVHSWTLGMPSSFLPVLHSALMHYSLPLADWLMSQGYNLYAKSDLRFVENMYKVLRNVFNYQPKLTREQFLTTGYAERKVILTCDVLLFSQAKHMQLTTGGKKPSKKRTVALSSVINGSRYGYKVNPPEVLTLRGSGSVDVDSALNVVIQSHEELNVTAHQYSTTPITQPSHTLSPSTATQLSLTLAPSPATQLYRTEPSFTATHTPPPSPASQPSHTPSTSPITQSSHIPPSSKRSHHISPTQELTDNGEEPLDAGCVQDSPLPIMTLSESEPPPPLTVIEEDVESWQSLPVVQSDQEGKREETMAEPLLKQLSSQVEQLTQMVEHMSARFILVETQLMLDQTQRKEVTDGTQRKEVTDGTGKTQPIGHKSQENTEPWHDRLTESIDEIISSDHNCLALGKTQPSDQTMVTPTTQKATTTPTTNPRPVCTLTPSPEETHQLIKNLRTRAHQTRLFLQQVISEAHDHSKL